MSGRKINKTKLPAKKASKKSRLRTVTPVERLKFVLNDLLVALEDSFFHVRAKVEMGLELFLVFEFGEVFVLSRDPEAAVLGAPTTTSSFGMKRSYLSNMTASELIEVVHFLPLLVTNIRNNACFLEASLPIAIERITEVTALAKAPLSDAVEDHVVVEDSIVEAEKRLDPHGH